jgi:hypothetical protein
MALNGITLVRGENDVWKKKTKVKNPVPLSLLHVCVKTGQKRLAQKSRAALISVSKFFFPIVLSC